MGAGFACREMKDFSKIKVVEGAQSELSEHGQSQQADPK